MSNAEEAVAEKASTKNLKDRMQTPERLAPAKTGNGADIIKETTPDSRQPYPDSREQSPVSRQQSPDSPLDGAVMCCERWGLMRFLLSDHYLCLLFGDFTTWFSLMAVLTIAFPLGER